MNARGRLGLDLDILTDAERRIEAASEVLNRIKPDGSRGDPFWGPTIDLFERVVAVLRRRLAEAAVVEQDRPS